MTAVAVVGLGAMGSRMARRLVHVGYEVVVWNRSPEKVAPLVELGAIPAATPAEAARRAQLLITMVTDAAALRAVSEGEKGIAAGADASQTVIEMSTVGPAAVARLASALPPGTGLLDAPVLGSIREAEEGTLAIFAGGAPSLVEQTLPVLSELGSVVHVGALGAGAAAKLVANATLFGTLGTLGEVIALARALGLTGDPLYSVLATTPLAVQAERRRRAIETGDYPRRFPLGLARKDAELIRDVAARAGLELRLVEAARTWLEDTGATTEGDPDYSAMLATILRLGP